MSEIDIWFNTGFLLGIIFTLFIRVFIITIYQYFRDERCVKCNSKNIVVSKNPSGKHYQCLDCKYLRFVITITEEME